MATPEQIDAARQAAGTVGSLLDTEQWEQVIDAAVRALPPHLWPCGCLRNEAGAHRVGCRDFPNGVRG